MLVHDAARPCVSRQDVDRLLDRVQTHAVGGILAAPAADTLKRAGENKEIIQTIDRTSLWRALTPQMFRYARLCEALDRAHGDGRTPTDEAQALEWIGERPLVVEGSTTNLKITSADDLVIAVALLAAHAGVGAEPHRGRADVRIGSGVDVHTFGPGDFVMLGGVKVPHTHGVVAHSDGDVILHALCDALLGAAGLGDIGQHFKDTDPQWRGADSKSFVRSVMNMLLIRKLRVGQRRYHGACRVTQGGPGAR